MKHNHKTGLFLIELIVGILFFSLASAICIQVFTKAKLMNDESAMKYQAARVASNIIETYKADQDDEYYENDGHIYYDQNWQVTSIDNHSYVVTITTQAQTITINITYNDDILYEIDYMHHQQKTF